MKFKVGAPARVGLVAPNDVEVPAGGTGLDPSSTNFFQVNTLHIACRRQRRTGNEQCINLVTAAIVTKQISCNAPAASMSHALQVGRQQVMCESFLTGINLGAQVLNIPTKINKGTVEITSNVALIKAGDKVGASEATLLAKLGIKPFTYGLIVKFVSCSTQSTSHGAQSAGYMHKDCCLANGVLNH